MGHNSNGVEVDILTLTRGDKERIIYNALMTSILPSQHISESVLESVIMALKMDACVMEVKPISHLHIIIDARLRDFGTVIDEGEGGIILVPKAKGVDRLTVEFKEPVNRHGDTPYILEAIETGLITGGMNALGIPKDMVNEGSVILPAIMHSNEI